MYNSYISLGWYCGVAGSMAKHGLRSFSGPFDWCFSDFRGILKCLDEDFAHFLTEDNLIKIPHMPRLRNTMYDILFMHEMTENFTIEYPSICQKYLRRIENFRNKVKQKCCFIRAIKNKEELQYVLTNRDYINSIIQKFNSENDIIFIVSKGILNDEKLGDDFFIIDEYKTDSRLALRGIFDCNEQLINFCKENINKNVIKENLFFDWKNEYEKVSEEYNKLSAKYKCLLELTKLEVGNNFFGDKNVVIYGLGDIGKVFYEKIKNICKVKCFVDINKVIDEYDGCPVLTPDELEKFDFKKIIVISCVVKSENVVAQLYNMYGKELIVKPLEYFFN